MSGSDKGKLFNADIVTKEETTPMLVRNRLEDAFPEAERIDVTEL